MKQENRQRRHKAEWFRSRQALLANEGLIFSWRSNAFLYIKKEDIYVPMLLNTVNLSNYEREVSSLKEKLKKLTYQLFR